MGTFAIAGWNNFLIAEAGAAAALTGLVFVAVSINLSRILSFPGLAGRAGESLCQLFGALVLSSMLLIPDQPMNLAGFELLGVGALLWALQSILQIRHFKRHPDQPRSWIVPRVLLSQLATLPFCIAGVMILRGWPEGFYWMAPGFIFSFVAGVVSAWVLLVEILR